MTSLHRALQPGAAPTPEQQAKLFAGMQAQLQAMLSDPEQKARLEEMAKMRAQMQRQVFGRDLSEEVRPHS